MPAYGAASAVPCIYPGDSYNVFSNETPANGSSSQQVAIGQPFNQGIGGFSVDYSFVGANAGTVSLAVQVANSDSASEYQTIDTLSSVSGGHADYAGVFVKFVRIYVTTYTAGSSTGMNVRINR